MTIKCEGLWTWVGFQLGHSCISIVSNKDVDRLANTWVSTLDGLVGNCMPPVGFGALPQLAFTIFSFSKDFSSFSLLNKFLL